MTLSGSSAAARTEAMGPSAAATCLKFKTPPAASLYEGIPQILFFGSTKFNPPLSVLEYHGALRATENGNCQFKTGRFVFFCGFV